MGATPFFQLNNDPFQKKHSSTHSSINHPAQYAKTQEESENPPHNQASALVVTLQLPSRARNYTNHPNLHKNSRYHTEGRRRKGTKTKPLWLICVFPIWDNMGGSRNPEIPKFFSYSINGESWDWDEDKGGVGWNLWEDCEICG